MLLKRVFGFGMVLGLAFLLLVSLVVSAVLSAFGDALGALLPEGLSAPLLRGDQLRGLARGDRARCSPRSSRSCPTPGSPGATCGSARWSRRCSSWSASSRSGSILAGAIPGEAFGAAGSLAVMLVWIYYSSMILLFGAEFTQAWAEHRGAVASRRSEGGASRGA